MRFIRAFNFKVSTLQKDSTYEKLPRAFPELSENWPTLDRLRGLVSKLSGVETEGYDCCKQSCHAFTGPYELLNTCVFCKTPRFDAKGIPVKQYHYIPISQRLAAQFRNEDRICQLAYRSNFNYTPGSISDIFSSHLYRSLLYRKVEVQGETLSHFYFSDPRDIALGISFDGFCPFKRRKQTCWPLIAFNYNLPPDVRFHADNVIPLGTIPGPKQMKDADSFLLPFVQEMLQLAKGIKVFDASKKEYFILRAYVILAFGDIPAAAKLMRMKGHNAYSPCRMCTIKGVRNTGPTGSNVLYVPLYRSDGTSYDPLRLPLRSPAQFRRQAASVAAAETAGEQDILSKQTGIKGIPVLSYLRSLTFPSSFPADFMHVIFENIIPMLLDLWTGNYKGFDDGEEDYLLPGSVFHAIGEAVASSGNTVPSSFGCKTPNPETERSHFTAEAWSMWAMLLAPILLRRRFMNQKFYVHFIKLIWLINVCLKFSVSSEELDDLEQGFANWVVTFEK